MGSYHSPKPSLRQMYSARDSKDRSSALNMIYMGLGYILAMKVLDTHRQTCPGIPLPSGYSLLSYIGISSQIRTKLRDWAI